MSARPILFKRALACAAGIAFAILAPGLAQAKPVSTAPSATATSNADTSIEGMPTGLVAALAQAESEHVRGVPDYAIAESGCVAGAGRDHDGAARACFGAHGPAFRHGALKLSLHLRAWGREGAMRPARLRRATPQANRVAYAGEGLQEWWRVLPIGYEQGFTIDRAPSGSGPIMLEIESSVAPTMEHGSLRWGAMRYGKLYVTDARGRVLPARLSARGRVVRLSFDATGARFPVTVDPLVWVQSQALLASPSGLGTRFGSAVAYSANGHVALIGTPGGGGAAFLFENVAGRWSHFTPLLPDDGTSSDAFGYSVALSADGTTAIVGAETKTVGSNAMQGAAYVFTRATQVAKLIASDGAPSDYFGMAVALSSDGTTAMVGAPDKTVGANAAQGAVYVYALSGGAWTQTAELTGADGAAYDYFGESLALARNAPTLLIGAQYKTVNAASYAGAAYVFTGTAGAWSQTGEFDGGGIDGGYFGHAVALSADGSVALVGALFTNVGANTAQGAAYVFRLAGGCLEPERAAGRDRCGGTG